MQNALNSFFIRSSNLSKTHNLVGYARPFRELGNAIFGRERGHILEMFLSSKHSYRSYVLASVTVKHKYPCAQ